MGQKLTMVLLLKLKQQCRTYCLTYKSISTTIKAGETAEGYISIQIPSSWKNLFKISYVPSQDNESRDAVVYNVTTDMVTEQ